MSTKPASVYQSFLQSENNLANALHLMGVENFSANLLEAALENTQRAIALKPNDAQYLYNYALVLKKLNRFPEALSAIEQSIALDPQSAESFSLLGNIQQELKDFYLALESYHRALEINPSFTDAYNNRAFAHKELREFSQATKDFEKVLLLDSSYPLALGNLIHTKMLNCDWSEVDHLLSLLDMEIAVDHKVANPFPFLALSDSPELQQRVANLYGKSFPANDSLGLIQVTKNKGDEEKIRIGYFSADFHNHATMYLIAELLELHNKERFEIHAFSFGPNSSDEMRQRCVHAVNYFHDVKELSDQAIAQLARNLKLDIAVDLKGYTQHGRPAIFSFRAAPIQMSYLGYPGTLGLTYIDYLIADEILIPAENAVHYSEKIVYLPHSYQVNDRKRPLPPPPPSRASLNLPEHGFVFCSFNNNYKITPKVFSAWMQILKRTPDSVLWLLEDSLEATQNLQSAAKTCGVDPSRLIFAKRAPQIEHLCRQQAADLFLDTFPYNAHTTASDALWVGLPILTRAGDSFASRVAASLLHAVDLPQLVCNTENDYVEKAIALAHPRDELAVMKKHLRNNRYSLPLFNTTQFTGDLESLYKTVLARRA